MMIRFTLLLVDIVALASAGSAARSQRHSVQTAIQPGRPHLDIPKLKEVARNSQYEGLNQVFQHQLPDSLKTMAALDINKSFSGSF
jgi:hypothetical protein